MGKSVLVKCNDGRLIPRTYIKNPDEVACIGNPRTHITRKELEIEELEGSFETS